MPQDDHPTSPVDPEWLRYSQLVLTTLRDHSDKIEDIQREAAEAKVERAVLKVKAGMWGSVAGAVTILLFIAIEIARSIL